MAARYRGSCSGSGGHTADVVVVLALLAGAAWTALTWVDDHGRQLVNAGAWWWGWLAIPVVAALLGVLARRRGVGPGRGSSPSSCWHRWPWRSWPTTASRTTARRPAYWPVGWTLLVVLGVLCTAAGLSRRGSR